MLDMCMTTHNKVKVRQMQAERELMGLGGSCSDLQGVQSEGGVNRGVKLRGMRPCQQQLQPARAASSCAAADHHVAAHTVDHGSQICPESCCEAAGSRGAHRYVGCISQDAIG